MARKRPMPVTLDEQQKPPIAANLPTFTGVFRSGGAADRAADSLQVNPPNAWPDGVRAARSGTCRGRPGTGGGPPGSGRKKEGIFFGGWDWVWVLVVGWLGLRGRRVEKLLCRHPRRSSRGA